MKQIFHELINFFRNNLLVLILFILSTSFFLIQHYFDFGWDFMAYIINAKFFFYGGNYFEVYRAPLISIILGMFLWMGKISEYIYILLVSCLFLFSCKSLSGSLYVKYFSKFNISKKIVLFLFYFFSLNYFLLIFGLNSGTELLALSFFQLFLANFILNKYSGHYLGLAFLSRYNFYIFSIFLLFNKSGKKILKNLGLFFAVIFPWLLFNKITWGNFFTSIADSFYLNIFSRIDKIQPFHFSSFLNVINWFFPFFILGIAFFIWKFFYYKNKIKNCKYEFLFLIISLLLFYDIYTTPFKVERYLFNFVLPIAFFSIIGTIVIYKNLSKKYLKILTAILLIGFFISIIILTSIFFVINSQNPDYKAAANGIIELGLENCQILSPHWVPVNYYTGNVRFMYSFIKEGLQNNEIMLIFPDFPTMDDKFSQEELNNFPTLKKTPSYVIIANKNTTKENCIPSLGYSNPMVSNPCEVLSQKFNEKIKNIFYKTCEFVNFKSS